jgi:hypothetical protein
VTTRVKVSRSGNNLMLPLPADLARAADADVGQSFSVELVDPDIIYHRWSEGAAVTGSGDRRVGVFGPGRALRMSGRASVPALNSWDF